MMRSVAIAEEAIIRGFQCVFIGEIAEIPWLESRVRNLGFHTVLEAEKDFIPSAKSDVLILDSYSIPVNHEFIDINKWLAVINIFDGSTPNYKSQLRIHPGVEEIRESTPWSKTLSGVKYVPIRSGIHRKRSTSKNRKLKMTVVGGGTDVHSFVSEFAKLLKKMNQDFLARLITTSQINFDEDARFEVIQPSQDVDSVFSDTDIAFTTAGTTSLEFLSCGCAVGIACAVDNQENNYSYLTKLGIAYPIGVHRNGNWNFETSKISALISDEALRDNLRRAATEIIDSSGAKRIIDAIAELTLELEEKDK